MMSLLNLELFCWFTEINTDFFVTHYAFKTNRLRNSFYPGAVASITTLPQSNDEGMLVERVLNICTQV